MGNGLTPSWKNSISKQQTIKKCKKDVVNILLKAFHKAAIKGLNPDCNTLQRAFNIMILEVEAAKDLCSLHHAVIPRHYDTAYNAYEKIRSEDPTGKATLENILTLVELAWAEIIAGPEKKEEFRNNYLLPENKCNLSIN